MSSETTPSAWYPHLLKQIDAILDHRQRLFLFGDELSKLSPEEAVCALRIILERGWGSKLLAERLVLETAMAATAADAWAKTDRRRVFDAALTAGDRLVSLLIGVDFLYAEVPAETVLPIPTYLEDRPLTLGERKSIARKPERKTIAAALRDPHPSVIRQLLDNPRLTENDVVYIAAKRPVPPEVLVQLGNHPKWRVSERVAYALVSNPHSPLRISLSLLQNLSRAHAIEAEAAENTPKPVREALADLLRCTPSLA